MSADYFLYKDAHFEEIKKRYSKSFNSGEKLWINLTIFLNYVRNTYWNVIFVFIDCQYTAVWYKLEPCLRNCYIM